MTARLVPSESPIPRYAVVGTAGHIDHGKSALVKALTGTDPDRLPEEQRRGMTLDLGFAHFDLPSGLRVGVVDVPGHERLVRHMLAGAAGLDLVLLVVAADEGIMPQTREHLDILRYLRVPRGLVVLSKADLVDDPDWLALVRGDVATATRDTFLAGAPVVSVSARTGAGLPDLVAAMDRALRDLPPRDADGPARLPVDRSFTMAGFGTVVTGTLWSGRVRAGDTLDLLPPGRPVRVRQVQSHGEAIEEARAGRRVALNLVGVAKDDVARGQVLAAPGSIRASRVLDVRLRLLPAAPALRHHERVRVYLGADEVMARVRLLDRDRLMPGEAAPAQLRLERPAVAAPGDPFVVRRYSPMLTVGGGEVVAVGAPLRRRGGEAARAIASREASGLDAQVVRLLEAAGRAGTTAEAAAQELGTTPDRVAAEAAALVGAGTAVRLRGRLFAAAAARRIGEAIVRAVAAYHAGTPWRGGMPREDLKSRAFGSGDDRLYGYALDACAARGEVVVSGGFVRAAVFAPSQTPAEAAARAALEAVYRDARFAPPARADALARSGERTAAEHMFQALLDGGILVDAGQDTVFHRDSLAEIEARVTAYVAAHGAITVAALRDELGSSRKFVLAAFEYLDARRVTRRVGDARVLVRPAERP